MRLSKIQRIVCIAVILAMVAIVAVTPRFGVVPILIALLCIFPLATSLGPAGRLVERLRALQGQPINIRVWGNDLPQTTGLICRIESIKALGAGLHFFVKCDGRPAIDLKVAQPRDARLGVNGAEIREARYVQWAGKRLSKAAGLPAVTVAIVNNAKENEDAGP